MTAASPRAQVRATLTAVLDQLARAPRDAAHAYQAADLAIDHGLEEEAVAAVAHSTALIGDEPRLWQMLGLLHRGLEQSDRAIAAFARAASLAPADARIAHGLALATMEAGLPACDRYAEARRLAPADDALILGHAAALAAAGRADEGLDLLRTRLRAAPDWLAGHDGFAKLAAQVSPTSPATETLDVALQRRPGDIALTVVRLGVVARTRPPADRLQAVSDARRRLGDHPALRVEAAIAASEADDIAGADRLFLAIGPHDNPQLGLAQLRHLCRARRYDLAEPLAARLVGGPAHVTAWAYRHAVWRLTGDPRLAWLEQGGALVRAVDLAADLDLGALAETLRRIHRATAAPLDQSVRGGTQTDGPLFARVEPAIRQVRAAARQAVAQYIAALPPIDPPHPLLSAARMEPPRFAGSWSVRLTGDRGGHHVNHIHAQGWLSSALYVALPPSTGDAGALTLDAPPAELGLPLTPTRILPPVRGRLILFPSYAWHGVTPFGAGERLSIAFDLARPRE